MNFILSNFPGARIVLAGGLSGLLGAVLIDLHAWNASGSDFDWKLAIKRWLVGAISGALAAAGVSQA